MRQDNPVSALYIIGDLYFLEFLGLSDTFSEKDLETAILRELKRLFLNAGPVFRSLPGKRGLPSMMGIITSTCFSTIGNTVALW